MEEPTKPDSGASAHANNDNDRKKQGRGNSRGGYKGRRGNKPKGTGTIYRKPEVGQKETFTGRSDDLKGYVYTLVSSKGGVQFTRTTEEVARYAGEKYSIIGAYVRTAILTDHDRASADMAHCTYTRRDSTCGQPCRSSHI
jgi:hypothetical protein